MKTPIDQLLGGGGVGEVDWSPYDGSADGSPVLIDTTSLNYKNTFCMAGRSATEVAAFYCILNGTISGSLIDCGSSGNVPVPGAGQDFDTAPVAHAVGMSAQLIEADKWLVCYQDRSDDDIWLVVYTLAGGNFSAGTRVNLHTTAAADSKETSISAWGPGYWAVAASISDGANAQSVALVSVTGTTPTIHAIKGLRTTAGDGCGVAEYSDTQVVVAITDNAASADGWLSMVTRVGETIPTLQQTSFLPDQDPVSCDVAVNKRTGDIFPAIRREATNTNYGRYTAHWTFDGSGFVLGSGGSRVRGTGAGGGPLGVECFNIVTALHLDGDYFHAASNAADIDRFSQVVADIKSMSVEIYNAVQVYGGSLQAYDAVNLAPGRFITGWDRTDTDDFYCKIHRVDDTY